MSSRSPVRKVHVFRSAPSFWHAPSAPAAYRRSGRSSRSPGAPALQRRVVLELLLDRGEMPIHQRAERRHRTLRVDERHEEGRALERAERALLAVLIDEAGVRNRLAGLQQLESRRRAGRRRVGGCCWQRRLADLLDVGEVRIVRRTTSFALMRSPGAMPSSCFGSFTL